MTFRRHVASSSPAKLARSNTHEGTVTTTTTNTSSRWRNSSGEQDNTRKGPRPVARKASNQSPPKRVRRRNSKQEGKVIKKFSLQQLRAALDRNNSNNNNINRIRPTSDKEHALVVEALVQQISQSSLFSTAGRKLLRSSIIVTRRSTTTNCSELTFDTSFSSICDYDDNDADANDLSEEESLKDDNDDDDTDDMLATSNTTGDR